MFANPDPSQMQPQQPPMMGDPSAQGAPAPINPAQGPMPLPGGQMQGDPMAMAGPMMPPPPPQEPPVDIDELHKEHHQNLLPILDSSEVAELERKLWPAIKKARDQNKGIKKVYSDMIRLLGATIPNEMDTGAEGGGGDTYVTNSGTDKLYSPTMLEVLLTNAQDAITTMMVNNAPFRAIAGDFIKSFPGMDMQALNASLKRTSNFVTAYLRDGLLPGYRDELTRSFMWAIYCGDGVRKIFPDPNRGNPRVALLLPGDYYFTGLDRSYEELKGFVHQYVIDEDRMKQKVDKGIWSSVITTPVNEDEDGRELVEALMKQGGRTLDEDSELQDSDQRYLVMEYYDEVMIHSDPLSDPKEWGALPYRIDWADEGKILSIKRNWAFNDSLRFNIKNFQHYTCMPSLDDHAYGLAQITGETARAATVLQRGLVDSAQLANVSTGFMRPSGRTTQRTFDLKSGTYFTLDGSEDDIRKSVYSMPYNPPDPVLMQLLQTLEGNISRFSKVITADLMNVATQAASAPLMAIISRMEQLPNGLIQRLYDAFCNELKSIKREIYNWLPANKMFTFEWNGEVLQVCKEDFSPGIQILPSNDFSMESQTYKFMRAQTTLTNAQAMPQLHNMPYVLSQYYKDTGYSEEEIKQIVLPPPPPPQGPPPPPPIDPGLVGMEEVKVQREKAQLDNQLGMKRLEVDKEKNDSKNQIDLLNLQLQNEKLQGEKMKLHAEMEKVQLEMAIKIKEMELREKDALIKHLQEHSSKNLDDHTKHLDTQLQALHSIQDLHSKEHTFHNPPIEDDVGDKKKDVSGD